MDLEKKIHLLEKKLVREKSARAAAEGLLEEKSLELYELNQKLLEDSRLLEATVINTKDGVVITDANLNGDGPKVVYVNDAFTDISGYSAEEVIGKKFCIFRKAETDKEILNQLENSLKKGQPFQTEIQNYKKNGTPYWLDISIIPVKNNKEEVTHFATIERDITAYKSATIELIKEKENAEAANHAKSEFLANMSHELRTPMNGIMGLSEILIHSDLNDEQLENATHVYKSSEVLLSLLNDILDISKIEANEVVIENIAFDISSSVESVLKLFEVSAQEKGLGLSFEIDSNVPTYIKSDLGRVHQILRNLLGNALKFTNEGYVKVFVELVEKGKNTFIHFSVQDTGLGIPEDKLTAIFEKFSQVDASVTRKFGGTGLGLAITQQLVSLLGGDVGVNSKMKEGSTFWFAIPLVVATHGLKSMDSLNHSLEKYENIKIPLESHILIVDDHPLNCLLLSKILKNLGMVNIDIAEDGVEALDKISQNQYNLVFMDCQMPNFDGYQTTLEIREREAESGDDYRLPVIALTANAMLGDEEKCLKSGMDDYLSKPIKKNSIEKSLKIFIGVENDGECESHEFSESSHVEPEKVMNSPVDMEHLSMFTDGDIEEESVLVHMFVDTADISFKILIENTIDEKSIEWRDAAHKFKGAAANIGAISLSKTCCYAEEGFELSEKEKIKLLETMKNDLITVKNFFKDRKSFKGG